MSTRFTLEYWVDDGWFVGRLTEFPGVFSQGASAGATYHNSHKPNLYLVVRGPGGAVTWRGL